MNSELRGTIRCVRASDQDFPEALRHIPDAPLALYVKGHWPLPESVLKIGVVGSRRATPYGLDSASRISGDLAQRGVMIVSGLAIGIDASAHRACLREDGFTVAVLGNGFAHTYPRENAGLYAEIAEKGTIITEFSHDIPPKSENFPQRNRIISGLSRGVVVVEAGEVSGALITARYAAVQGRDVFAVPGSTFHWQSKGCHRLIKEGARLVESAQDVLEEYGVHQPGAATPRREIQGLSKQEQELFSQLNSVPLSVDELVELTGQRVDRLAEVLLSLELKGLIMSMPGHRYAARN